MTTTEITHPYEVTLEGIDGQMLPLDQYRGKYLLIVNVASRCGHTKQYTALQALAANNADSLQIIGCPCNQFGGQEPADHETIQAFTRDKYGVTFPLTTKLKVNGKEAHPLFTFLKQQAPGALNTLPVKWNFTKFLISPDGAVLHRFASRDKASEIVRWIGEHEDVQWLLPE